MVKLKIDEKYTASTVDNDILITVGDGSILLKDTKNEELHIVGSTIIEGTEENDGIENKFFEGATINALGGNDFTFNSRFDIVINGKDGNYTICNTRAFITEALTYDTVTHDNVTINAGSGNDSIYNDGGVNVSISGGDSDDIIDNTRPLDTGMIYNGNLDSNTTINGGAGNDSISNQGNSVKIYGGVDSDYIYNEGGQNTLFKYSSGDGSDEIHGFNATSTLQIGNGTGTYSTKTSGSDIIITVDKGNDSTLGNACNDKLYGQSGNDILKGGKGNDSLWGGKGNDSLWGDSGADVFSYSAGEGKDIIYGFADNDMLKITGAFSASYSKSKDEVYFKVGTTSKAITLKDFSAASFNINGTTYKISGSKLK